METKVRCGGATGAWTVDAGGCKVRWDEEEKEMKEKKEEGKDGVVQQQAGDAGGKRGTERG